MPPRLFLIIGARNTAVEKFVSRYVGIGPTPHATHVTHGHLRDDVDSNPTVANGVSVDVWRSSPLVEVLEFVRKWTTPDEPILTSNYFVWIRDSAGFHSYYAPLHDWDAYKWAVFAIDDVMRVDPEVLWHIWRLMRPVLANERFVCYSSDPRFQKAPLISRGIGRIFVRLTTPLARMCSWKANLFASTAIKIFQKTVKAAWDIWTSRTAQKLMQTAKYSCSKVQRRIVVVRPTHRLSPGRTCSSKHQ
jgi:hypothetical protein